MSVPIEIQCIETPIATGELIDKITILEIKSERITDHGKLDNVRTELALLCQRRDAALGPAPAIGTLTARLKSINERLWQLEDDVRDHERRGDHGPDFVAAARAIFRTNDERAQVKREINLATGSTLIEEKLVRELPTPARPGPVRARLKPDEPSDPTNLGQFVADTEQCTLMASIKRTALIFGISGQDGAYLADLLLREGFEVHGTSRDKEISNFAGLRALDIADQVTLHSTMLSDFRSVLKTINSVRPDHIYNLAAQSSVGMSFEQPVETIDSIMHGTINVMEAMRFLALDARLYNAASSECFGNTAAKPADETTEFRPRSPYAVGKAASFWAVANYREAYGLFACNGILFNHELPFRSTRYVTQKIVRGAADIAEGKTTTLELGALDLSRDWGWAPEYVDAMRRMLDQPEPEDFVIATGHTHSLEEFVAASFACFNLDWREHVRISDAFRRPSDIAHSSGDPSKALKKLGWKASIAMPGVVERLVEAERMRRRG